MSCLTQHCAVYTRKSTEDGLDQEFNSLDAQREACEAYIKSQASEGWKLSAERFDDGGFTGGNMDRPALQRLLDFVKRRKVQVIVVYKIDRLTRSLADFARLVEVLDEYGASFVSVTQQFNTTTSMGRLTLNVLLSFAQFEREVTSERIRDKIGASKRRGLWMGGYPPLGYDIKDRKLVINKEEALAVRAVFECAQRSTSLTALADEIEGKGVKGKAHLSASGRHSGGARLSRTSLHRLLRNPVYIGKIRQDDRLFEGEHEAIIDEALWAAVQERLDSARRGRKEALKAARSISPLASLLYDDAGNRMVATHSKTRGVVHRYYVSLPKIRPNGERPGSVSRISAPVIEKIIAKALNVDAMRENLTTTPSLAASVADVDRIIIDQAGLTIHTKGGRDEPEEIRISADLASAHAARKSVENDTADRRDPSLIRAVALARDWTTQLQSGEQKSARAIAEAFSLSERYVWKILRLAFLAPDIVAAILEGRQPKSMTLRRMNETKIPTDWSAQREALGFPKLNAAALSDTV